MTTYAPKTLLRLYKTDNTYVCTAVVLNTGQVYEVKNHDGVPKKTYDSHESWKAERGADMEVRADETKSSGSITGKPDANGFIDHCGYAFTQWLLTIMREGTPHLLKNEAVRDAFNNLTATAHKYREVLVPHRNTYSGRHKYYIHHFGSSYSVFGGFPVYVFGRPVQEVNLEDVKNAYLAFMNLVRTDMVAYVKKKSEQIQAASDLKYTEKMVWKCQCRIRRLEWEMKQMKIRESELLNNKAKLEEIVKS